MSNGNKFASADFTMRQMNAIVKKMGGADVARKFLRGELRLSTPSRQWIEENGIIRFSIKSDGTTGKAWISRLNGLGCRITDYAKSVLRSPDFHPTNGVTTEIAVLKGELFIDDDRFIEKIRAEARRRKLQTPSAELACFIREFLSDEDLEVMGLWWIITMHESIKTDIGLCLLGAGRSGGHSHSLHAFCRGPDDGWHREYGFAFVESQVQP
jgi:hypothetical protein